MVCFDEGYKKDAEWGEQGKIVKVLVKAITVCLLRKRMKKLTCPRTETILTMPQQTNVNCSSKWVSF